MTNGKTNERTYRENGEEAFAHSLAGQGRSEWEPFSRHLSEVAFLTGEYAVSLSAQAWGDLLGRCHDLGKLSEAFHQYLGVGDCSDDAAEEEPRDRVKTKVDHSTFGARFVADAYADVRGQVLAYCIAGHHAGLPDEHAEAGEGGTLRRRLDAASYSIPAVTAPATAFPVLKLPFAIAPRED